MPNPVTYPGQRSFLSAGVETLQGTPVPPTATLPVVSFLPVDNPNWIEDLALYGDMAALHGLQQAGLVTGWDLNSYYFGDYSPMFLHNILGDLYDDGTYTGSGTTTLSSQANPGATTITVALSLTSGQVVAIGAGTTHAEIRTLTSTGTSPTFAVPLLYTHSAAEVVRPTQAPWTHVESLLNTAQAQPGSLTLIDWQGLTPTTQARAYAGSAFSDLTIKGIAESEFITVQGRGIGYPSAAAAALPVAGATAAVPISAWRALVGFAGPASGGTQVKTVSEFDLTITRQLKPYFTMQGSQSPYWIQRGNVRVTGRILIPVPADETFFNYMINNTQPQVQLVISNGQAGANLLSLQVDLLKAGIKGAKIQKNEAIGYEITFEAIANTTNAGNSGGRSPVLFTTSNAVHEAY